VYDNSKQHDERYIHEDFGDVMIDKVIFIILKSS